MTQTKRITLASAALVLAALPASQAPAQQQAAPYTVVETGRGYQRLQDAVNAIGGGRGTCLLYTSRCV